MHTNPNPFAVSRSEVVPRLKFLTWRSGLWVCLLVLGLVGVVACQRPVAIAEADYRKNLIGDWVGTVGEMKESMSFRADGSFIAQLHPQGFISDTLSQGVTGTIRGSWTIAGKIIQLKVLSAEDERLSNRAASSQILAFDPAELLIKSDQGVTTRFIRTTGH